VATVLISRRHRSSANGTSFYRPSVRSSAECIAKKTAKAIEMLFVLRTGSRFLTAHQHKIGHSVL